MQFSCKMNISIIYYYRQQNSPSLGITPLPINIKNIRANTSYGSF
jgi:hypothetical protein